MLPNSKNRPVVFVVEDNDELCSAYEKLLGLGATVLIAKTIDQAYQLFAEHRHEIDLIVMDGCVPGNDYNTGELLADIRSAYHGDIIATSSSHRTEQLEGGCNIDGGIAKFRTIAMVQKMFDLPTRSSEELAQLFKALPAQSGSTARPAQLTS